MLLLDRILGILALAALIIFLYILGSFVLEPDLIVVIVIGILMACYDFWIELFATKPKNEIDDESEFTEVG